MVSLLYDLARITSYESRYRDVDSKGLLPKSRIPAWWSCGYIESIDLSQRGEFPLGSLHRCSPSYGRILSKLNYDSRKQALSIIGSFLDSRFIDHLEFAGFSRNLREYQRQQIFYLLNRLGPWILRASTYARLSHRDSQARFVKRDFCIPYHSELVAIAIWRIRIVRFEYSCEAVR